MRAYASPLAAAAVTLGLCWLPGCSGSGGGGGGGSLSPGGGVPLEVLSVSVLNNSIHPLNRSIRIRFSQELDFSTVSGASISISTNQGQVALGSYSPLELDTDADGLPDSFDRSVVVWQPACPILPDYSDAGLVAGVTNNGYSLRVRGTASNPPSVVTSLSGSRLVNSVVRVFNTALSADPSVLFDDPVSGPPQVRVRPIGSSLQSGVTRIELGGNSAADAQIYFERDDASSQSLVVPGAGVSTGSLLPLNLYADPSSQVAFLVEFNQPVNTSVENLSANRIRVEYLLPHMGAQWTGIDTDVRLIKNCSATGALLRLEPIGLLPRNSQVRASVLAGFEGIKGLADATLTPQSRFAVMDTLDLDYTQLMNSSTGSDGLLEEFDLGGSGPGSLEDTDAFLTTPSAVWGQGSVRSTLNFPDSSGQPADFDWYVTQNPESFDTSLQTILGGPDGQIRYEQFTVGGVVNVRDFVILPRGLLLVRGPNPFVVNATGEIRIEGVLNIDGGAASDVATLNTGSQPEPGGSGNCGGGDGGTASELRSNSTPQGGSGFGPFGLGQVGGIGGESGYSTTSNDPDRRRPGGGGGGRFTVEQSDLTATGVSGPEPSFGMQAGSGFPGHFRALGALDDDPIPDGGPPGIGPFVDGIPNNDFFGLSVDTDVAILVDGTAPVLQAVRGIITGELDAIHAGYGGGAGGDASPGPTFPTPNWTSSSDEKGGGGGGGAGAVNLRALGPIRFVGVNSALSCRGGRGATGENVVVLDRIGGSGGSGTGGHVILESASRISFELPPLSDRLPSQRRRIFIDARGVRGRVGGLTNGVGVILPVDESYGGHGGPGLIQLHVPDATAPPHEDASLSDLVLPVGTIAELDAGDENALLEVMRPAGVHMLSSFGRLSTSQSRWVDLRRAGLNPDGSRNLLRFLFDGIDPVTGLVQTTRGRVNESSPILTGTLDAPTGSFVGLNGLLLTPAALQPLITSAAPVSNDLYLRTPRLLRNFTLRMTPVSGLSLDFAIQDASYDASGLSLTVAPTMDVNLVEFDSPSGAPSFSLIPRFLSISTDDDRNGLPDEHSVRITFDGAREASNGLPDTANLLIDESSNLSDFDALTPGELGFIRFRIEFNIDTRANGVSPASPTLSVDFLRLPFIY